MWVVMPKLVIYIASIISMAFVYMYIWRTRPDYFRVQPDVNFWPLDWARVGFSYVDPTPIENRAQEMMAMPRRQITVDNIRRTYEEIQTLNRKLEEKRLHLDNTKRQVSEGDKAYQDSAAAKIRAYAAKIREGATVPPFNLADFYQTPEQREFLKVVEERIKANDEFVECFEAYTERRNHMEKLWEDYRKANALSYWDFLYFSIGAATTATFGDIAPYPCPASTGSLNVLDSRLALR
jgi:hypothetical protein